MTDSLYLKIDEYVKKLNFAIYKDEVDRMQWKLLKRSCKDHDHYTIKDVCYLLVLSDCKSIIEIIEDDTECSDDNYSVELDTDDDWLSGLDEYESEEDEDYSPVLNKNFRN